MSFKVERRNVTQGSVAVEYEGRVMVVRNSTEADRLEEMLRIARSIGIRDTQHKMLATLGLTTWGLNVHAPNTGKLEGE